MQISIDLPQIDFKLDNIIKNEEKSLKDEEYELDIPIDDDNHDSLNSRVNSLNYVTVNKIIFIYLLTQAQTIKS